MDFDISTKKKIERSPKGCPVKKLDEKLLNKLPEWITDFKGTRSKLPGNTNIKPKDWYKYYDSLSNYRNEVKRRDNIIEKLGLDAFTKGDITKNITPNKIIVYAGWAHCDTYRKVIEKLFDTKPKYTFKLNKFNNI